MSLSNAEQLERAERQLKLDRQRLALTERKVAVLSKRRRRGERGELYARQTQQKCVLGYSVQQVLSDTSLPGTVRNRLRELLARHISEPDQIVVAEWLAREADQ